MTQTNSFQTQPVHSASLVKRMLVGGGGALILITIILLGVREPKPEWGKLWMIRPLIIVPLAGATGGMFYYFINHLFNRSGWRKVLTITLGIMVYIIGLWLGTVLGLDGTLWN